MNKHQLEFTDIERTLFAEEGATGDIKYAYMTHDESELSINIGWNMVGIDNLPKLIKDLTNFSKLIEECEKTKRED